jgi:FixJ family two-component response regulator
MAPAAARARPLYIVDTDASVRDGLVRLAESAGFEPRPCRNIEEFLRRAEIGYGACALVDLSDAGLRQPVIHARLIVVATMLPLIALSAADDARARRMADEVGARAFFRKPVDAAALLDSIDWATRKDKTR